MRLTEKGGKRNASNEHIQLVFQGGDIIVRPGEEIFTEDPARIAMFGSQYAWQFSETKSDKAQTEAEVKAETPTKGVHPLTGEAYVQVDDEGKQAKKIG